MARAVRASNWPTSSKGGNPHHFIAFRLHIALMRIDLFILQ
jgi:hypothetical protein